MWLYYGVYDGLNVRDAVLIVLGLLKEATVTRIHKLLFLAVVEGGIDVGVTFKPHYFGPWSPDIQRTLNELVREDLVTLETGGLTEEGYIPKVYRLTDEGRKELELIIAVTDRLQLHRLKRILARYGHLPLSLIIAYIYSKYPDYTELSTIKERVERWKKYYRLR